MGYVDLHAHFLPALDDGSPDLATSMDMLRAMVDLGYERVTATPHQKANQFLPTLDAIQGAYATVTAAVAEAKLPLALSLAAENFWDSVFFDRWETGGFPRYDGGKAFLFEIHPEDYPVRFEDRLFALQVKGYFPVMAHPERFRRLNENLDTLRALGERCALVVDLGALAGEHGWRVSRMARKLVLERIAHAAASDVHSVKDVKDAAAGIAWIRKKLGDAAVKKLCDTNPRQILAGELPVP